MGADEYLERLKGKIRKCLFFYVKIFKNNSVSDKLEKFDFLTFLFNHCICLFQGIFFLYNILSKKNIHIKLDFGKAYFNNKENKCKLYKYLT